MSNVIYFGDECLFLGPDVFDIKKLVEDINKAEERSMLWWYVQRNYRAVDGGVEIDLGRGRSEHSWRDFRALMLLLGSYLQKPVKFGFYVNIEDTGYDQSAQYVIEFTRSDVYIKTPDGMPVMA